ncbi:hypothetical protein DPMN_057656 [Dreissena polymorpha]|uniref:Uncharacterized protein n=1 Tax=Dreissena polymorpha TaxID=45954 RepID=A0A9D4C0D0_DREPO|nr:hypothetical protein DPMN_057656 [Dreissena polymorpha]
MARQRPTRGAPGLVIGPCRVAIDRIVIRDVHYQFEVNQCINEEVIVKGNFWWAWSMWAGMCQVEIDRIVIIDVQYQFEVNRCRNEEVIVKGNFWWAWPMWGDAPGLVMGPCIVEIDRIVIRVVQYQFEDILKGNFGWAWSMFAGSPQAEIDRIVIRDVQYQFEVDRCRNEEVNFQGSMARTDGQKTDAFQKAWG